MLRIIAYVHTFVMTKGNPHPLVILTPGCCAAPRLCPCAVSDNPAYVNLG